MGSARRGLQRERTSLAWNRTAVSFMVAGTMFLDAGGPPYRAARHAPGIMAIAFGALLFAYSQRRSSGLRPHVRRACVEFHLIAAGAVCFSLAALALVVFGG